MQARVDAVKAQTDVVKSNLFPKLNALVNLIWVYFNKDIQRQFPTLDPNFHFYTLGFDFSYEFDFWGKNKKLFLAALGEVKTREAMLADAKVVETETKYLNRREVVESGAISEEEYIISETDYYSAKAAQVAAKYNLMKAMSEVQNTTVPTHPIVEIAKSDVREAYINLQRCTLRSPVTGIVALRKVQVGQSIIKQLPLMAVIPLEQMWVDANFKEVDLSKIRIGQPATITSDIYGREVVYKGEVIGIGIGSGAVFSPLPPQNATGNWIKIVQRIPVRISIEPKQLLKNPLRLGLSMNVTVDVHDVESPRVPDKSIDVSICQTDVFHAQLNGFEDVIKSILDQNQILLKTLMSTKREQEITLNKLDLYLLQTF